MKLHRDIGVSQPTAWFMLHRIRESWVVDGVDPFEGPVEFDETYVGGRRANMSNTQRAARAGSGRGPVEMTAVIGAKDRTTNAVAAEVVERADKATVGEFAARVAEADATIDSDGAGGYAGLLNPHEAVVHSVSAYVRGNAHINGIDSFWSMLKRAHKGTFHKISPKNSQRYVNEFVAKHNFRESDTVTQMQITVAGLVGRRLFCRDLVADNGSAAGAGS